MKNNRSRTILFPLVLCFCCGTAANAQESTSSSKEEPVPVAPVAKPHPTTSSSARFVTNRTSKVDLPLPTEEDAFVFAVYGDRTGGPPEGIKFLKQAVKDTNLFEPDLVMTVGDLIQGYNTTVEWLPQMREYKSVMGDLLCPWFPVAGNHDIYWRGPGKPKGEHEASYEMHFGPLWYAFQHKNCWFIVLYSDEGNPETGLKAIHEPGSQKMSPEQFEWLKKTLGKTKDAMHVFVFLHHPRWLGRNYGDDWDKVHKELANAGNVSAVFAGHIHRMRYDGPRDGIEYVTLATVGGGQSGIAPKAGYLHQFHLITVRKQQVAMACLPVGETMNVRAITGQVSDEVEKLAQTGPRFVTRPLFEADGQSKENLEIELRNPTSRPVEYTFRVDSPDQRWMATPDHAHCTLEPGDSTKKSFRLRRFGWSIDENFRTPDLVLNANYLTDDSRISLTERNMAIPIRFKIPHERSDTNRALSTRNNHCIELSHASIDFPDGPMTVECWFKPNHLNNLVGLFAKTESSEYGLFVGGGVPFFTIHLGGKYIEPHPEDVELELGKWHHMAGVFDGNEVRTYINGKLSASTAASGSRKKNTLPLMLGADVRGNGGASRFFNGQIDTARLSKVARYSGETFEPSRRWEPDGDTVTLLNLDEFVGPYVIDESENCAHGRTLGAPVLPKVE